MSTESWPFDIVPAAMVVTTSHVTHGKMPIEYVTHETDEEDGVLWQFHCGNGDFRPEVLQLVRLDSIVAIDPGVLAVADLPLGFGARRSGKDSAWIYAPEPE
jgi:hypothetical protein